MEVVEETEEPEEAEEAGPPAAGTLVSADGSLRFPITQGVNRIGRREADNDIAIPDAYCSGRHAEVLAEDGKFIVTDVGSTNGTLVNGEKLQANEPRDVQESDEVTFGQSAFRIEVA